MTAFSKASLSTFRTTNPGAMGRIFEHMVEKARYQVAEAARSLTETIMVDVYSGWRPKVFTCSS